MKAMRAMAAALACLCALAPGVGATTKGIWMHPWELADLDTANAAWTFLSTRAYSTNWQNSQGGADPKIQVSRIAGHCVGAAMVWQRRGGAAGGDPWLRARVRDSIMKAVRKLDDTAEYNACPHVLTVGRQLAGYCIAADLIDLESFAPDSDAVFRPWLDDKLTREFPQSNPTYGKSIVKTHESTNTWGMTIGSSRIAILLYLGGRGAEVARCDSIFRAHTDQAYYPAGSVWFDSFGGDYFRKPPDYQPTWVCGDTSSWLTISPSCLKTDPDGGEVVDIDGAIVTETSRKVSGGPSVPFVWPPWPEGANYHWESMKGLTMQAELLDRAWETTQPFLLDRNIETTYGYGNSISGIGGLRRCMDFIIRAGYPLAPFTTNDWLTWVLNKRYGTTFQTRALVQSDFQMGWTDWTHGAPRLATLRDTLRGQGVLGDQDLTTKTTSNAGSGWLTVTSDTLTDPTGVDWSGPISYVRFCAYGATLRGIIDPPPSINTSQRFRWTSGSTIDTVTSREMFDPEASEGIADHVRLLIHSPNVPTAPDGSPWTWATLATLKDVRVDVNVTATRKIHVNEVWVEVYGQDP